jgi:hypothetical protein
MSSSVPIAFIHSNKSWYVPYTLNQATSINRNSNVFLLSNGAYKDGFAKTKLVDFNSLNDDSIGLFKKAYIHRSTNSEKYETFCWLRWFYLLSFMKSQNLSEIVYLDSDILLFQPVDYILSNYLKEHHSCGLMIQSQSCQPYAWSTSGHLSYWTRSALQEFCDFSLKSFYEEKWSSMYEEKWRWHTENKISGGICDMTTLYLFWQENKNKIANFAQEANGGTCDYGFGTAHNFLPDEYCLKNNKKQVDYVDGKPVFRKGDQRIYAYTIHFQGKTKKDIPDYYRGSYFFKENIIYSVKNLPKKLTRLLREGMRGLGARKQLAPKAFPSTTQANTLVETKNP